MVEVILKNTTINIKVTGKSSQIHQANHIDHEFSWWYVSHRTADDAWVEWLEGREGRLKTENKRSLENFVCSIYIAKTIYYIFFHKYIYDNIPQILVSSMWIIVNAHMMTKTKGSRNCSNCPNWNYQQILLPVAPFSIWWKKHNGTQNIVATASRGIDN